MMYARVDETLVFHDHEAIVVPTSPSSVSVQMFVAAGYDETKALRFVALLKINPSLNPSDLICIEVIPVGMLGLPVKLVLLVAEPLEALVSVPLKDRTGPAAAGVGKNNQRGLIA